MNIGTYTLSVFVPTRFNRVSLVGLYIALFYCIIMSHSRDIIVNQRLTVSISFQSIFPYQSVVWYIFKFFNFDGTKKNPDFSD